MRLNRIYYLILAFTMFFTSCGKDVLENVQEPADGMVRISSSILLDGETATKSMAAPHVNTLHFAVFDSEGYLCEYRKADLKEGEAHDATTIKYGYTVDLTKSEAPRVIHVIANGPDNLDFGHQNALIGSLCTSNGRDAYWQCLTLNNGIVSESSIPGNITLIRNYAKVNLQYSGPAADFELEGYMLVNTPKSGSIAPYNRNTGVFQSDFLDYLDVSKPEKSVDDLLAADKGNYRAFMPSGVARNVTVGTDADLVAGNTQQMLYESAQHSSDAVYIIVKGKYKKGSEPNKSTYYKILLRDKNKQPFDIIRNFYYMFHIKSISAPGWDDLASAASSDGSTGLEIAAETSGLNNLSNGESRIFVSFTDTLLVDQSSVKLRFKFIPDVSAGDINNIAIVDNDLVDFKWGTNTVIADSLFRMDEDVRWVDSKDGFSEVTITPKPISAELKEQTITLVGTATHEDGTKSTLKRTVTFRLRNKVQMKVRCVPSSVEKQIGQDMAVVVELPAGIGELPIFPTDFKLEAQQVSLTPNTALNQLPIYTGESIISEATHGSYGFIKTITKEEFDALPLSDYTPNHVQFVCYFKTNKKISASEVYVANKYFTTEHDAFDNHDMKNFTNLKFSAVEGGASISSVEREKDLWFSFNTSGAVPEGSNVMVKLTGLAPEDTETHLLASDQGDGVYILEAGVTSFHLVASGTSTGNVELSCFQFNPASKTIGISKAMGELVISPASATITRRNDDVQFTATHNEGGEVTFEYDSNYFEYVSGPTKTSTTTTTLVLRTKGTNVDETLVTAHLAETASFTAQTASAKVKIARRQGYIAITPEDDLHLTWNKEVTYEIEHEPGASIGISMPSCFEEVSRTTVDNVTKVTIRSKKTDGSGKFVITLPETDEYFGTTVERSAQVARINPHITLTASPESINTNSTTTLTLKYTAGTTPTLTGLDKFTKQSETDPETIDGITTVKYVLKPKANGNYAVTASIAADDDYTSASATANIKVSGKKWQLVSDASELKSDDIVMITNTANTYALGNAYHTHSIGDNYVDGTSISGFNEETAKNDNLVFTVIVSGTQFRFKSYLSDNYLRIQTGKTIGVDWQCVSVDNNTDLWTVSVKNNVVSMNITSKDKPKNRALKYEESNRWPAYHRFAYDATTANSSLHIWKYIGD